MRGLSLVYSYVDDSLAFSKSEEDHTKHLTILFEHLNEYDLTINLKKCKFGRKEVKFLGHVIAAERVLPASDKIQNFEKLENNKGLRRFPGVAQIYAPSRSHLSRLYPCRTC